MPIQINELIIKATIESSSEKEEGGNQSSDFDQQAIIEDCVEQVLEILNNKNER